MHLQLKRQLQLEGMAKEKKFHMVPMPVYLLSRCSLQFMNIKVEKCASDIFVRCGVKIFPAFEKDLSIGYIGFFSIGRQVFPCQC